MEKRRIVRKLGFADKLKLMDWLKAHKSEILSAGLSKPQVCTLVKTQLSFDITPVTLTGVGNSIHLIWPRAHRHRDPLPSSQFKTLVLAVRDLYTELNLSAPSADFAQLVHEATSPDS